MADSDDAFVAKMKAELAHPALAQPSAVAPTGATPTPQPQAAPAPLPLAAKPTKAMPNPFAPLVPVVTGAKRAAGTGVGKVMDVLNRGEAAVEAGRLRGPSAGFGTLIHSNTPEQNAADNAELARRDTRHTLLPLGLGPELVPEMTKAQYDAQPGWWHQSMEMIEQMKNDPSTYLGGTGIMEHLVEATGAKSLPAFARAVDEMSRSSNPNIRKAGAGLAKAYDFTHYKGETQRALAAANGAEGIHQFRGLKSINNARLTQAKDLSQTLLHQYEDVTKGLKPDEETALYKAIHTGTTADLPENLAMRAAAFKNVTDSLAHLSADPALRAALAEHGFELPASMQRFESEAPRGLQGADEFRQNYVPTKHQAGKDFDALDPNSIMGLDEPATHDTRSLLDIANNPTERVAKQRDVLDAEDKNLRERGEGAQILEDPDMQRRVVQARLKSGAQAIAASDAEKRVAELFGKGTFQKVPPEAKKFFQETYNEPGAAEFWKGLINVPKVGLFALPFRHMANIGSLSFLADPTLANVYGTAGKFARLMLAKDPEARAKILGAAGKYGVAGTPSIDRHAAGWVGQIPGIGELYKASNHMLWTFDDAAKATRFEKLMKQYKGQGLDESHSAYRAADQVGAELIDYSNQSPLTKALGYIAPFATYRSKVPGAIARSVVRHPEVSTNLGRMSPELVGDYQEEPGTDKYGDQNASKSFLPLADTFRGVENPWEYARATAGYPGQMVASALGIHGDDYQNYMTYGKKPDARYALNATLGSFPGFSALLNKAGLGEFQTQGDMSGALGQQLGFGNAHAASAEQQQNQADLDGKLAELAAAHKSGNHDLEAAIEANVKTFLKYHSLFEK